MSQRSLPLLTQGSEKRLASMGKRVLGAFVVLALCDEPLLPHAATA
jgi:hypothetical protein